MPRRSGRLQLNEVLEESKRTADEFVVVPQADPGNNSVMDEGGASPSTVTGRKRSRQSKDDHSDGVGDDFGENDLEDSDKEEVGKEPAKPRDVTSILSKWGRKGMKSKSMHASIGTIDGSDTSPNGSSGVREGENSTLSIGRKDKAEVTKVAPDAIPKKKVPRKTNDAPSSGPSLLSNLTPGIRPPPVNPQTSKSNSSTKSSAMPSNKSTLHSQPVKTKEYTLPASVRTQHITSDSNKTGDLPRSTQESRQGLAPPNSATQAQPPTRLIASTSLPGLRVEERRLMAQLQDTCHRISDSGALPLPMSLAVDVSGSFLQNADNRFDFFDTNSNGEVVLQRPKPIFPEEFAAGMREHPLSWWGIVDPRLGENKYQKLGKVQHQAHDSEPRPSTFPRPGREMNAQQYHNQGWAGNGGGFVGGPNGRGGYRNSSRHGGGYGRPSGHNGNGPPPSFRGQR